LAEDRLFSWVKALLELDQVPINIAGEEILNAELYADRRRLLAFVIFSS